MNIQSTYTQSEEGAEKFFEISGPNTRLATPTTQNYPIRRLDFSRLPAHPKFSGFTARLEITGAMQPTQFLCAPFGRRMRNLQIVRLPQLLWISLTPCSRYIHLSHCSCSAGSGPNSQGSYSAQDSGPAPRCSRRRWWRCTMPEDTIASAAMSGPRASSSHHRLRAPPD